MVDVVIDFGGCGGYIGCFVVVGDDVVDVGFLWYVLVYYVDYSVYCFDFFQCGVVMFGCGGGVVGNVGEVEFVVYIGECGIL